MYSQIIKQLRTDGVDIKILSHFKGEESAIVKQIQSFMVY